MNSETYKNLIATNCIICNLKKKPKKKNSCPYSSNSLLYYYMMMPKCLNEDENENET